MNRLTRRDLLRGLAASCAAPAFSAGADGHAPVGQAITALVPKSPDGAQFVLMSDCCSGIPGSRGERNLRQVNAVVRRLDPAPEFIAFPGDAIAGFTKDVAELRRQWKHWYSSEMKWITERGIPLYQSTSNHNAYDGPSEEVFREFHAHYPQNGPESSLGLSYFIRRGELLYVSTHQPNRPNPARPGHKLDTQWIDRVLGENRDARYKFVAGHYPALPINGYSRHPNWSLDPDEREALWNVLRRHGVTAYLASHVIAFDVRARDGILQIVSAGAGTEYGPSGAMPGATEFLHATQIAVDRAGLRYQVLDVDGRARETLDWPLVLPSVEAWEEFRPVKVDGGIVAWRFRGALNSPSAGKDEPQTLLAGDDPTEGPEPVWIGFESGRLVVRLVPESGRGSQTWTGPLVSHLESFDLTVAIHPGMGPGGILHRASERDPWTSLTSDSPRGAELLGWPRSWFVGHAQSGPADRAFQGRDLKVNGVRLSAPAARRA